jgi:MFS family permease
VSGSPSTRLRIDTSPLRTSRDFRRLFSAGVISYLGSMFTVIAVPLQAQQLTGSFVVVGFLGLVEVVPIIVFGLWGGAIADHYDRRVVIVAAETGSAVCATLLLVNAVRAEPQVWVLFAIGALAATFESLQRPSLEALVPQTVEHDRLAGAAALMSLRSSAGFIFGTAIAGVVASTFGVAVAYAIDVVSFLVSIALLLGVRSRGRVSDQGRPGLSSIAEGIGYAWSRKDLLGTYAIDTLAMLLAFPYAVFPFVAEKYGAPWALGLLYAAPAVGDAIASLTSGWTARVHRHGRAIVVAASAYGLAIACFGLASSLWVALLFLAVSGAFDMASGIFRQLIWNQSIPDELRGRLAGIELLSYSVGPSLGNARVSLVAQSRGLAFSIASGGILCAAGVVALAAALPTLWSYDERTSSDVAEVRRARLASASDGDD